MASGAHSAPRARRSWPQRLGISVLAALTVCATVGAMGMGYAAYENDQLHRKNVRLAALAEGKPANYLIVGSDSRAKVAPDDPNRGAFGEAAGGRSDSIIVARVDPHTKHVSLLSLPRDLWVPIAGHNMKERINSAYSMGTQTLIDTVQQTFHIPINHYIEVDFAGFEGLVKAIDGVPMYFDTPMRDRHSGLMINMAGCTVLNGSQGLAFARSRYLEYLNARGSWTYDPTGDLGRISRQQYFIRKAMKRAVGKAKSDPLVIKSLVDVGVANVTVDNQLSFTDLLTLANRFKDFDSSQMQTYSVPTSRFFTAGGADVLALDQAGSQPVLNLFRDPVGPVHESDVRVRVLNGTRGRGTDQAIEQNVAGALKLAGFHLAKWGQGSEVGMPVVTRTKVLYGADALPGANLVARHLAVAVDVQSDPDLADGAVVVVAGSDLTGVTAVARPVGAPAPTAATTVPGSGVTTTTAVAPTTTVVANAKAAASRVPGEPPPGVTCG